VLAARAAADDGWTGEPEDVVWLGPTPNTVLEPTAPPARTPEAMTLMRETIEIAFLTLIQLLTPQQRAALILCDVLDWSAKDAADLLDLSVPAVNSALQRARVRLRERLPSRKPPLVAISFRHPENHWLLLCTWYTARRSCLVFLHRSRCHTFLRCLWQAALSRLLVACFCCLDYSLDPSPSFFQARWLLLSSSSTHRRDSGRC